MGIVFNIQKFCLSDGPGIRTTVFLKGCPLRCAWCHNPESQKGGCETAPDGNAYGEEMTVDAVMAEVMKDAPFYENSGGGMTVSGGEPFFQAAFTLRLLQAAKAKGLHTCVETGGFADPADLLSALPYVDLFLYDWKHSNSEEHKRYTGVGNQHIAENLRLLDAHGANILLRCPIIPTVNDTREHFDGIVAIARSLKNLRGVELLPYHTFGMEKYAALGRAPTPFPVPTEQQKAEWVSLLQPHLSVPVT